MEGLPELRFTLLVDDFCQRHRLIRLRGAGDISLLAYTNILITRGGVTQYAEEYRKCEASIRALHTCTSLRG